MIRQNLAILVFASALSYLVMGGQEAHPQTPPVSPGTDRPQNSLTVTTPEGLRITPKAPEKTLLWDILQVTGWVLDITVPKPGMILNYSIELKKGRAPHFPVRTVFMPTQTLQVDRETGTPASEPIDSTHAGSFVALYPAGDGKNWNFYFTGGGADVSFFMDRGQIRELRGYTPFEANYVPVRQPDGSYYLMSFSKWNPGAMKPGAKVPPPPSEEQLVKIYLRVTPFTPMKPPAPR